jgi:hypothetical protein
MEDILTITYRGKEYVITLVASTEEYPHFYWCLIDDPELIEAIGDDCISFKMKQDGVLYPIQFYPGSCQDLVEQLRELLILQYIHTPGP